MDLGAVLSLNHVLIQFVIGNSAGLVNIEIERYNQLFRPGGAWHVHLIIEISIMNEMNCSHTTMKTYLHYACILYNVCVRKWCCVNAS